MWRCHGLQTHKKNVFFFFNTDRSDPYDSSSMVSWGYRVMRFQVYVVVGLKGIVVLTILIFTA